MRRLEAGRKSPCKGMRPKESITLSLGTCRRGARVHRGREGAAGVAARNEVAQPLQVARQRRCDAARGRHHRAGRRRRHGHARRKCGGRGAPRLPREGQAVHALHSWIVHEGNRVGTTACSELLPAAASVLHHLRSMCVDHACGAALSLSVLHRLIYVKGVRTSCHVPSNESI